MYKYNGKVTKVVDGDTIHVLVDLGFEVYNKVIFRLAKINAPEKNTEEGVVSKNALTEKLMDKDVCLDSQGKDKYGRWIASVYLNDENISDWLLNNNYAVVYK